MKNTFTRLVLLMVLCSFHIVAAAQKNFFKDAPEATFNAVLKRVTIPEKYRTINLDTASLKSFLADLPSEKNITDHNNAPVIEIPMPDGTTESFHVWESSVMEPALAAKFPTIKTFTGQGIEDGTAVIKIDWTEMGFHAMILSPVTTSVFIDPYSQGNKLNYISYFKADLKNTEPFKEDSVLIAPLNRPASPNNIPSQCIGTQLSTYRLAVACTHQYAIAATGLPTPTVAQTLSAITTSITRVDGVYEEELDIHFVLVANEDKVIFNSSANDPLSGNNSNPSSLVSQSQAIIDDSIGDANYDIGHTFSTGAGGLSELGVVCISGQKASSVTGLSNPTGDAFNIDYVAHEIGHEFGAHHSFNSVTSYCGASGQFSSTTNTEPGSGTTIMCYAEGPVANGLCGTDNLQVHSDPDFNAIGFDEITNYINNNSGNNCSVKTATGNTPPVVNAGSNYIIPASTPFILTGSATDVNMGDNLTYSWEEFDIGGPGGTWNHPSGNAPIFRSFPPVTTPSRYFPKLSDVINNTTTIGEILPTYSRTMHFRFTVRDNHAGGGGVCFGSNTVSVIGSAGPFKVTYPNATGITLYVNSLYNVTWNTANTQSDTINCANVTIQLSIDGGQTYPITLLASTANNGTAQVQIPNDITSTARIRVMAVGNIFYDISDNNFSIASIPVPVDWISFTASGTTNSSNLSWTVNEINVDHYEIERSSDGVNFVNIGKIASTNGNYSQQKYTYTDLFPLKGENYYRIKEVNTDGGFTYSSIVSLSFDAVESLWTIYPNPAVSYVKVVSNEQSNNIKFELFDVAGKLLYKNYVSQTTPGQLITIPLSRYSKGIYSLKITSNNAVKVQKIELE